MNAYERIKPVIEAAAIGACLFQAQVGLIFVWLNEGSDPYLWIFLALSATLWIWILVVRKSLKLGSAGLMLQLALLMTFILVYFEPHSYGLAFQISLPGQIGAALMAVNAALRPNPAK